jgi:hypothetical protein
VEKRHCAGLVIKPDEGAMLFSRGILCRVNPMSAWRMKQGIRVVQGVNHYEGEKL